MNNFLIFLLILVFVFGNCLLECENFLDMLLGCLEDNFFL